MILWFALFIPVCAGIILQFLYPKKVTWWETVLPTILGCIIILSVKTLYEVGITVDTEYRGNLITTSKYYEYWSTWVEETCSRQDCTGSGKDEHCTTVYYDCSHCDENPPHWVVEDNSGRTYSVSEEKWMKLLVQWNAKPEFINEHRDIDKHYSCGVNGNTYKIHWDNKIETSEASVSTKGYVNKILGSKNAFSYKEVTKEEKKLYGLYEYPEKYDLYKQEVILGFDAIPIQGKEIIRKEFEYLNGLGSQHHGKLFICLFPNKDMEASFKQEALWVGGKRNELTICIGYNPKTFKMDWVRAFSWDKDKRCIVESRESLMEVGNVLQWGTIFNKVYNIMVKYHKPRDFKDFNYLDIELPTWAIFLVYILTVISTVLLSRWAVINEYDNNA